MRSVQDMLPISQALGFTHGQSAEDGWASLDELFGTTELRRAAAEAAARGGATAELPVQLPRRGTRPAIRLDRGDRRRHRLAGADPRSGAVPPPDHPPRGPAAARPAGTGSASSSRRSTSSARAASPCWPACAGRTWVEAARKVAADLGIPLDARIVGPQAEAADVLGRWAQLREITDAGALLVRPDHHIAWRSTGSSDAPGADLDTALRRILARADIPAAHAGHDPRSAA